MARQQRDDDRACRRALAAGSRSFATAALLLPRRLRRATAAWYAFCRHADDVIDLGDDPGAALIELHALLDRVYAGRPAEVPLERALARCVGEHGIARAVPDALLEGFAWDATGRTVEDEDALLAYAVRVASTVGVAMTAIMGVRSRDALARACDLGVAMQLTNIARDVGEDARRGRVYLPNTWLDEAGIDRAALLANPSHGPALASVVARTLTLADRFYDAAAPGIALLPRDCRPAIAAARSIYADIGRDLREHGCDAVGRRAHTSAWRKLQLLARAWLRPLPVATAADAEVLAQARALVEAGAAP
ncbi:MAG: phytoene/squalene synthase family protein [Nannocystaceae bacterium]|nr:phytoene/squalene synthase family protein [Nannocystaceae bacterium]